MVKPSKKTKGKRKIEMKTIEKYNEKMITFSKRRSGIYKKASELVTLAGVDLGVLVFSPTGKPHSFAHPSIEALSNRFLGVNPPENDDPHPLAKAHRQLRIAQLNEYHNDLLRQLEAEKKHGKMLQDTAKGREGLGWWQAPIHELNLEELHQMDACFEELIKNISIKQSEKIIGGASASSSSFFTPDPPEPAGR